MEDNTLLPRLEAIRARYEEVEMLISDPSVISDMTRFKRLNKEYKDLQAVVDAGTRYRKIFDDLRSANELMYAESDEAFRAMAKEEITLLEIEQSELEESIRLLLIPKDPEDIKNAVLEIRAGTGGDEASIFAGDLARMYMKFCENKGW